MDKAAWNENTASNNDVKSVERKSEGFFEGLLPSCLKETSVARHVFPYDGGAWNSLKQ